jgi:hypothetical protein
MGTEDAQDGRKPICVVVDTSVWRAEPLLKTPMGLTLVYTLSRRKGFIGLPEVVESELKRQIVEAGRDAVEKARGPLLTLGTLTDDPGLSAGLPSQETLERMVDKRLATLSPLLIREAFTLEHAKAALEMVNAKVPPNQNNQQFKDSAIWRAVLSLSVRYQVTLLTKDKSFFTDRDPAKGLAPNLLDDCRRIGCVVLGYCDVGPYLDSLRGDVPTFDNSLVKSLIVDVVKPLVVAQAKNYLVEPTEVLAFTLSAFQTEKQDRLAIDYTISFRLDTVTNGFGVRPTNVWAVVHGSTYYLPQQNALDENFVQRIAIKSPSSLISRSFRDYDGSFEFPRPLPSD